VEHLKKNGNKLNMEQELLLKPRIYEKKQAEKKKKKKKKKSEGMVKMWCTMLHYENRPTAWKVSRTQ